MGSLPIAILVCGRTVPPLRERRGDFVDWFRHGLAADAAAAPAFDLEAGEDLPPVETLGGCIVTGSPTMVTEELDWSVAAEAWLAAAHGRGLPILGVCYGHQMLARALGGTAGDNPAGREIGTAAIELLAAAESDALLGGFQSPLQVQVSHSQSALTLPTGAVLLARSAGDPHQAFRVGETTWGVQFHPEFDADIVRCYIEFRREEISAEGLDVDALLTNLRDDARATTILRRFSALCGSAPIGTRPSGDPAP